MATKPKTTIGKMDCVCCKREIPVKRGEHGTLNFACQWCDFPGYAKQGTECHEIVMGKLKNQPEPAPAPAQQAPAATKTVAKPAPAPAQGARVPANILFGG